MRSRPGRVDKHFSMYIRLPTRSTSLAPEPRPLPPGDSEFDDGLGWNFDFLLRLRIEARASLPFLLYELAKSRQDEFSVLFDRFVGERAESIEEYSGGSLGGLGGSSECDLKFRLCHVYTSAELALSAKQADALSPRVPFT
jgi:hypothetical protein